MQGNIEYAGFLVALGLVFLGLSVKCTGDTIGRSIEHVSSEIDQVGIAADRMSYRQCH
jgi:hypothetical protein